MNLANDDRSDDLYSMYGQVEYKLIPKVRVVGALRWDDGDLFDRQFSPKGAVVFSPDENNSFRFSVNKAFQTPNYSEFFLQVPVAAPSTGPGTLQATIQGYYQQIAASRPRADAGRPDDDAAVELRGAFRHHPDPGARARQREPAGREGHRLGAGLQGQSVAKAYVTADVYINELKDFVTDLLPGVNPAQFPSFALDDGVELPADLALLDQPPGRRRTAGQPPAPRRDSALLGGYAAVQTGTTDRGANALATLPSGNRAVVLSYTNAGQVTERGVEVGLGYQFTPEIRGDVSFTGFDFTVKSQAVGDQLVPNTPSKKGSVALTYAGQQGIDANINVRLVDGYQWAAGVFVGYVPSNEFVNVSAGYRVNNYFRIHATATNVFDQQRFQLYGGSVIGRRVLGGITAQF